MADQNSLSRQRDGTGPTAPEAITITIEPGHGNRLGVIHDMLRDLGLELCASCQVWKPHGRIVFIGVDFDGSSGGTSFSTTRCTDCVLGSHPSLTEVADDFRAFRGAVDSILEGLKP